MKLHERLDLFEVRKLKVLFKCFFGSYDYSFHISESAGVPIFFLEYNIPCEAQYLRKYQLIELRGIWLYVESEVCTTGAGHSIPSYEIDIAGNDLQKALDFMIEKIVTPFDSHIKYYEKSQGDKKNTGKPSELRKALRNHLKINPE